MSDGNLRQLFTKHLPEAMWTPVETFSTGRGIPDVEYIFPSGATGWIENKRTLGWRVEMRAEQIAWLERRARMGGRAFIAVRRQSVKGPRKGAAADELWLIEAQHARMLYLRGLKEAKPLGLWTGGPAQWSWDRIKGLLTR